MNVPGAGGRASAARASATSIRSATKVNNGNSQRFLLPLALHGLRSAATARAAGIAQALRRPRSAKYGMKGEVFLRARKPRN